LTLLVGQQERHPACKKTGCWFVGGDDLTGALHNFTLPYVLLQSSSSPVVTTTPSSFASVDTS